MNKVDNVSYVSSTQGSARLPVGAVHLVRDGQGEPLHCKRIEGGQVRVSQERLSCKAAVSSQIQRTV